MSTAVNISGYGIVSPIGIGRESFTDSLQAGRQQFSRLALEHEGQIYQYPTAVVVDFKYKERISSLGLPEEIEQKAIKLRNLSKSSQLGIYAALEAWKNSNLFDFPALMPAKAAIVSSGSNMQQAAAYKFQNRYRKKINFINPSYGFTFLDTDIVGALTELLNIQGEGYSIGAASASGNMALIQGARLIESGAYDLVVVVAPAMEFSIFEYQTFTSLGAMASLEENQDINSLCRPFDTKHSGFVYGENAGCIILESAENAKKRNVTTTSQISGYGIAMDANRLPNPSVEGECRAMNNALEKAEVSATDIDLINTHGTASKLGDQTEVEALVQAKLEGIAANATKGLIGHGISSAGLVEAIACLCQLEKGFIHSNPNLKQPISDALDWTKEHPITKNLKNCLSNSFGFGGINTSIILSQ